MPESMTEPMRLRLQQQSEKLRALPVVRNILIALHADLSPELHYHNAAHSEDVLFTALRLGVQDELSDRQLELLAIAAAYHDAGYLVQRQENEPIGAAMARDALLDTGEYSNDEIGLISQMIEDTRLQQHGDKLIAVPSSELSKYLLDADLSNLGRENFWESNQRLQRETQSDPNEFRTLTSTVFLGHSWLTPAAKELFTRMQIENYQKFLDGQFK